MNQINRVGNILPTRTRENPNQGRVYDVTGIAPAICCGGGTPLVITRLENERISDSCDEREKPGQSERQDSRNPNKAET